MSFDTTSSQEDVHPVSDLALAEEKTGDRQERGLPGEELTNHRAIPPDLIRVGPNVRRDVEDEALDGLAASMREVGMLQPLKVAILENGLELQSGFRRFRAAELAGLETVPVVISEESHREELVTLRQLIENVQRAELPAIDLAEAINNLIEVEGFTSRMIAEFIGKSEAWVHKAKSAAQHLSEDAAQRLVGTPQGSVMDNLYETSQLPADSQDEFVEEIVRTEMTRDEVRVAAAEVKAASGKRSKRGRKPSFKPITVKHTVPKKATVIVELKSVYLRELNIQQKDEASHRLIADVLLELARLLCPDQELNFAGEIQD